MFANNRSIVLPSGEVVFGDENIIPDGHFLWREVTHNQTRVPENIGIEGRIYKTAHRIEEVRRILGNKPIIVHSWYRNKAANEKIKNFKKYSRHLFGDAIDFSCLHLSPKEIYKKLDNWHQIGGLSAYKSHVHIDWRGEKARW